MQARKKDASYQEVADAVDYDPLTGLFVWRHTRNGKVIKGNPAGSLTGEGYMSIGYNYKTFIMHRLAFFIVKGEIPPIIDHINGIRHDNRMANLRECTPSQNSSNATRGVPGISGVRGVKCASIIDGWGASITVKGELIDLGIFSKLEDAANARISGEAKYLGEFSIEASKEISEKNGPCTFNPERKRTQTKEPTP